MNYNYIIKNKKSSYMFVYMHEKRTEFNIYCRKKGGVVLPMCS